MQGNGRIRGFLAGLALATLATMQSHPNVADSSPPQAASAPEPSAKPDLYIETFVTGYNTVREQTDDTPCVAASGANICGRRDTVACPQQVPLGAIVEIRGRKYRCEDRMARKFGGRFDINCDKDRQCPFRVTGWTKVKVLLD